MNNPPTSQPPAPTLHRGLACLQCRRRKIRCDAHKPACGSCQKLIANWRPETQIPKPQCDYDTIPSSSIFPSTSSTSRGLRSTTPRKTVTPSTASSQRHRSSNQLKTPSRKRDSEMNVDTRPGSLSRSRSQSQSSNITTPQPGTSFALAESDPFRTYSRLPRRASSPGLAGAQLGWREGAGVAQYSSLDSTLPPLLLSTSSSSQVAGQPSMIFIERLVALFFKHCSIASILRKDLYSVDKAISGSELDQALLRATLAISVLYSTSPEDISGSRRGESGAEEEILDAQTVGNFHATAARNLIEKFRSDDNLMEELLPISLLLIYYGMQSGSLQSEIQVQAEMFWSAMAVRRLGFFALASPGSTSSNAVPTVCSVSTSSSQLNERSTRFWAFYIMDRQLAARRAVPPSLSDQDISTLLPSTSEDQQRISPSSRFRQASMSLNSSIFVTTQSKELSWVLFVQAVRLFSRVLNRQLPREESAVDENASLAEEILEIENKIAVLVSKVREEVPTPVTHLSTIRLLVHASQIVWHELKTEELSLALCLSSSRAIAAAVRSLEPDLLKCLDFFTSHSFWIGGRSLIRQIAAGTQQTRVSEDELLEDLRLISVCLWRHGETHPRSKQLARCLLALYKTTDSPNRFVSSPSFWPPEALIQLPETTQPQASRSDTDPIAITTSLLELSHELKDSELLVLTQ